ncbi:pyridoxal phosphate-dependent aminotransferase [Aspergillus mulundensis]|uniref:Pyridoxal phosphate-dependent transferase, major protein n=1 Tax=Aspergillus mulundensis TaxID=1810919 RepID=A0A3D8QAP6_9EURO|nr:Pyridoxal phosphate-dependent transferase, major protein [Aspergillus mulundensis]RDW58915.1 Pyridoxal phosphate-dependent transferase, major protein [Aspergillus mulundensis]
MDYRRMAIEKEAPEEVGAVIRYNLSESAISDQTLQSLQVTIPADLVLTYTEHRGSQRIRSIISQTSGGALTPDDILITAGASTSLFIVATALLRPQDHLIITRPNYATNLETPRAIGCQTTVVDLAFEDGFRLELDGIARAVRPGVTKLISICSPNNPTGSVIPAEQLVQLASLAGAHGCYLLVDETYIDLTYPGAGESPPPPMAATLGDHIIGVSSMSKAYGVPGIRVGWLSTTNPELQESFLAAKEQISICGSVLDELVAEQVLARRDELLAQTRAEMKRRRDLVAAWIEAEADLLEWVPPQAGVMCFVKMRKVPLGGTGAFYHRLLHEHGVYVGPGRWFDRPDTFFRLGFGWPSSEDLQAGLQAISLVLRSVA